MSGMPATFDAERSELYKIHTIHTARPTMLLVSNVTFDWSPLAASAPPLPMPVQWHWRSGLLATADHVRNTVYSVTTLLCSRPLFGSASCTRGNTDTQLTAMQAIRLIEMTNLLRPHASEVVK